MEKTTLPRRRPVLTGPGEGYAQQVSEGEIKEYNLNGREGTRLHLASPYRTDKMGSIQPRERGGGGPRLKKKMSYCRSRSAPSRKKYTYVRELNPYQEK